MPIWIYKRYDKYIASGHLWVKGKDSMDMISASIFLYENIIMNLFNSWISVLIIANICKI